MDQHLKQGKLCWIMNSRLGVTPQISVLRYILDNSRLDERVSPKRETQRFKFEKYGNLTQAKEWSFERKRNLGKAVKF
ncbi:hypothetical protein Lal_00042520 [Lupinus albus]|nr:hypothetical protein Lal_00042520 [Lupinus albus]